MAARSVGQPRKGHNGQTHVYQENFQNPQRGDIGKDRPGLDIGKPGSTRLPGEHHGPYKNHRPGREEQRNQTRQPLLPALLGTQKQPAEKDNRQHEGRFFREAGQIEG